MEVWKFIPHGKINPGGIRQRYIKAEEIETIIRLWRSPQYKDMASKNY